MSKFGSSKEEFYVSYQNLKAKYGKEIDRFPLGAIGIYRLAEKIGLGLQLPMARVRKWRVDLISRRDLAALTEGVVRVTGLPHIMEAYRKEAPEVIQAGNGCEGSQLK